MRWIGQHIWQFISRFRSDVYLEDVDTGTIASGGNLGLDSNNKIVKNTVSGGGGDFTLTADSGSNQTISTGNTMDIAGGNAISTVVGATDTVTINHDDTSSQASVNNSGRTFIQDITLDTYGHVTGITSATDSDTHVGDITSVVAGTNLLGGATSGAATLNLNPTLENMDRVDFDGDSNIITSVGNLTIQLDTDNNDSATLDIKDGGGTVVASFTENGGLTLNGTIRQANGSTVPNKGSAGDILVNDGGTPSLRTRSQLMSDLSGQASGNFNLNSNKLTGVSTPTSGTDAANKGYADRPNKLIQIYTVNFKDDIGTDEHFIPLNTTDERTSNTHEDVSMIAPYAGKLKEIHYRVNTNTSGATATWKLVRCPKTAVINTSNTVTLDTQTTTGPTNTASGVNNVKKLTFDADAAFDQHDLLAISVQHDSDVTSGNKIFYVTAIFEFDVSNVSD